MVLQAEAEEPSAPLDENDIGIFRRVFPAAKQSRGRSIGQVLYDRSIRGPRGVGGVKKSLSRRTSSPFVQASPSSVIHHNASTSSDGCGDGDGNKSTCRDYDETDSLSEILGDDCDTAPSSSIGTGTGHQNGHGNGHGNGIAPGMLDNNMNNTGQGSTVMDTGPTSPSHRSPFPGVNGLYGTGADADDANTCNGTQVHSVRLKMNAYPTNISTEINNFAEQCSVNKFNSDYLSLDKMKAPTHTRNVSPVPITTSNDYYADYSSNGNGNQTQNPSHSNSNSHCHERRTFRRRDRDEAEQTEFAVSTISIAFAPDGRTVASTHGDHTVKISCCHTGALVRSLDGHPRTPWTVKYHPTQSNIVASGCLGHQVRIWDWNHPIHVERNNGSGTGNNGDNEEESDAKYNYHQRKGVCLKMIRLRNSIISLSFHPTGSILAIACGHTLHLWVYDNGGIITGGANTNSTSSSSSSSSTNAVIGASSASANASASTSIGVTSTNSEVMGTTTATTGAGASQPNDEGQGQHGQTVLHQIRYANNLRCVHFPPGGDTIIIGGVNPNNEETQNNETSYSLLLLDFDLNVALMSPMEFNYFQSIDPEDRRSKPPVEVLKNYRTFLPRALLYNDGGFDISEDGKQLCGCANLWLPFGVNSAAELIEREESEKISVMERSFNNTSPKSSPSTGAGRRMRETKKRRNMDLDDGHEHGHEHADANRTPPANSNSPSYNSPPRMRNLPPVGDCLTPPNPSRPDPTSPPSPPGRRWVSKLTAMAKASKHFDSGGGALPPLKSSTRRQTNSGRYVPHVVVVSLDDKVNALGESTLGKVLEATPLQSRASSVTCVKFSPSAEYCLLGYGVREQGQTLPYHPVNSLYRVKGGMTQVASMLSRNDDVNIARFHPQSGVGFVYGTKQGRVRVLAPRPWNYYYD